ncbi:MAG: CcdB family protein [Salinisphaera sp.]|nr:CcdB family protein [Salinisphaera sp.]
MARFDVCRNEVGSGYLLDVQSDLLSDLNTRVVVPLLPKSEAPLPAERLNPEFEVGEAKVVMATQYMAAVPESELRFAICNMAEQQIEISTALDMLFLGF